MITNQAWLFIYLYNLAQIYAILQVFQLTKANTLFIVVLK